MSPRFLVGFLTASSQRKCCVTGQTRCLCSGWGPGCLAAAGGWWQSSPLETQLVTAGVSLGSVLAQHWLLSSCVSLAWVYPDKVRQGLQTKWGNKHYKTLQEDLDRLEEQQVEVLPITICDPGLQHWDLPIPVGWSVERYLQVLVNNKLNVSEECAAAAAEMQVGF